MQDLLHDFEALKFIVKFFRTETFVGEVGVCWKRIS